MALYKHGTHLKLSDHTAFDTELMPGTIAENSGIYRCIACGDEVAANKGNPLPPQNHKQHSPSQGSIRWKLLVFSQQH